MLFSLVFSSNIRQIVLKSRENNMTKIWQNQSKAETTRHSFLQTEAAF